MTNELVIVRVFDASRELVWRAWTDASVVKAWWGPRAFSVPVVKIDFRVGGKYFACMQGRMPDGKEMSIYSTGTYLEIVPLQRIVVTDSFAGRRQRGSLGPLWNAGNA